MNTENLKEVQAELEKMKRLYRELCSNYEKQLDLNLELADENERLETKLIHMRNILAQIATMAKEASLTEI